MKKIVQKVHNGMRVLISSQQAASRSIQLSNKIPEWKRTFKIEEESGTVHLQDSWLKFQDKGIKKVHNGCINFESTGSLGIGVTLLYDRMYHKEKRTQDSAGGANTLSKGGKKREIRSQKGEEVRSLMI